MNFYGLGTARRRSDRRSGLELKSAAIRIEDFISDI
jgi:hypothetical protein